MKDTTKKKNPAQPNKLPKRRAAEPGPLKDAMPGAKDRYRDLFENANDAIFLVDSSQNYIDANRKAVELSGYSKQELLRMNILDLVPDEQKPRSREEFLKLMREGRYEKFQGKMLTKGGRLRDIQVSSSAIMDGDTYVGSRDIVRDITDQVTAEETLRESEEKFRNIFDNANDGILIINHATRKFIEANSTICAMLGYSREELKTLGIEDIHPKNELPRILAQFEKQHRGELLVAQDIPVRRKDGTIFYVDIKASVLSLHGEHCSIGVFRDITDRKQVEETLKLAHTRLRTLIQAIPDMVIFKDTRGRHLMVNKATEEVTGLSREGFIGKTAEDLLPPGPAEACRKSDEQVMSMHASLQAEEQVFEKSGGRQYIEMLKAPMVDDAEKVIGLVAIGRDITERKRAEEALRNSERFVRNILDTVDEGFIVIDRDFRIVNVNKAYCEQVGEAADRIIGRHCYDVSHRSRGPCYEAGEECAVRAVFETGHPASAVHRHTDGKGSILYVETKGFPIADSSGAVTSVIETVNNITEKHLLEEERLKTQKLEAIGTLAGGIAHDFNNLLQGVFGYISMARATLDQKERSVGMLKQAEQALHMSVNLTKQLLTFSKGGSPMKRAVSLRQVVDNSVKFALSGSRVGYRIQIDEDLRMVEADEGQISQVIQNIVLNADQAMPLGGTIEITVKNMQFPGNGPARLPGKGNYVEISIRDSGIGIPSQYLARIFDPYFTTKDKGSGLGLATSYSIIRNHGGVIDVASEIGKGTVFSIYLPAIEAREEQADAPVSFQAVTNAKILFMDDEELIRNVAGEMVKNCGHRVDFAENGRVAIEKYQAAMDSGAPYDIVILDLTIRGGLGGKETIERLRAIDPHVRAIVSSGYSDDSAVSDYQAHGFAACLTKPYELEKLRDTLNRLLR